MWREFFDEVREVLLGGLLRVIAVEAWQLDLADGKSAGRLQRNNLAALCLLRIDWLIRPHAGREQNRRAGVRALGLGIGIRMQREARPVGVAIGVHWILGVQGRRIFDDQVQGGIPVGFAAGLGLRTDRKCGDHGRAERLRRRCGTWETSAWGRLWSVYRTNGPHLDRCRVTAYIFVCPPRMSSLKGGLDEGEGLGEVGLELSGACDEGGRCGGKFGILGEGDEAFPGESQQLISSGLREWC